LAVAASASVRFRGCLLIQASGNLDEQTGQQIPVGLNIAEFREHPFYRCASVFIPPPDVLVQRLGFVTQSLGEIPVQAGQLVGKFAEMLLQSLDLFP
jgi:hypothetical protein